MRMREITTLFLLLSITVCRAQATKEQKFKIAVREIINAFSKQDSATLIKYIHPKTGFYLVHRVGVFDQYSHFKTIGFKNPAYPSVLFQNAKGIKLLPLRYASLPTFNCKEWSKKGFFVDTTKTDHLLSRICKDRNKHLPDSVPLKTIQSFYSLENRSRRIVLIDDNYREAIFYVSYLNERWYLTIVDYVSSDCSV